MALSSEPDGGSGARCRARTSPARHLPRRPCTGLPAAHRS